MRATHGSEASDIPKDAISNWIKVSKPLHRKRRLMRLAALLGMSEDEAVGACVRFWAWADDETDDGHLPGCTRDMVDRVMHRPGFAAAMIEPVVGWLLEDELGLIIPNFCRHQGESAKKRALKAESQANWRKRKEQ